MTSETPADTIDPEAMKRKLEGESDPYILRQLSALQDLLHFLQRGKWNGKLEMDVNNGRIKEMRPRIRT